jgi:hypothetical protein
MKKAVLLLIACAAALAQCDVWQKPLIEAIVKETKKVDSIEKIMVTKYPFPNTFSKDNDTLSVLKNGGAESWESKCGLEVSGITNKGEIRTLTAEEYTVESFDPDAFTDGGKIPVTVTLNGAPGVTISFDIAIVSFSENYHEVKIAAGISNGTLITFPSGANEGELVTVYIYPDDGYACKNISNIPPPPQLDFSHNEDGTITFIMPSCELTLTAEFFKAEAKLKKTGQSAIYYDNLKEAFENAGSGEAVITLLSDIEIEDGITVNGNITLAAAPGKEKTISRAGNFQSSLFTVESAASLKLDADYSLGLTVDGGKDDGKTATNALVTVSGGALEMGERVKLQNNNNSGNSGGVRVDGGGTFNMTGGMIIGNRANYDSGGVRVQNGTFNMTGGVISGNTAGSNGGGVLVSGSGTFTMEGGVISGNTAAGDTDSSRGGGVYVHGGIFNMTGGTVNGNTAADGSGVYAAGNTFEMSGSAVVKQDNDVYLPVGKVITAAAALTPEQNEAAGNPKFSAKITPANPGDGLSIITGTSGILQSAAGKFTLNTGAPMVITIDGAYAKLSAPQLSMKAGSETVYFASLQEAVSSIGTGGSSANPAVISLMDDADIDAAITIASNKHIKIKPDGKNVTVKRGAATSSLFTISSNASLTLEGSGNASLVIDGGWFSDTDPNSKTATSALVYVNTSGTFTLNDGAALKNNKNTNSTGGGGGVYIASGGTFNMNGGEISGNTAANTGSGVYVYGAGSSSRGIFNMYGGKITGNKALFGGGVHVFHYGRFTMYGGEISGNEAEVGGGVYMNRTGSTGDAFFILEDGSITGNKAVSTYANRGNGGGVYGSSSGGYTFIMNGGLISDNEAYILSDLDDPSSITGGSGGGIYFTSGDKIHQINAGFITGNKTGGSGGGLCLSGTGAKLNMTGGTFSLNTAGNRGGGVYFVDTFTMSGGTIYGTDNSLLQNEAPDGAAVYKTGNVMDLTITSYP